MPTQTPTGAWAHDGRQVEEDHWETQFGSYADIPDVVIPTFKAGPAPEQPNSFMDGSIGLPRQDLWKHGGWGAIILEHLDIPEGEAVL